MMDIECCRKAWLQGVRLLRVHYNHGYIKEAMAAAIEWPDASFVMLTMEYEHVHLWCDGEQHNCVQWISNQLQHAQCEIHQPGKCILFR